MANDIYIKKQLYDNAVSVIVDDLTDDMAQIADEINIDSAETISALKEEQGIAFSALVPLDYKVYEQERENLDKQSYKFPSILSLGALKAWDTIPSDIISSPFASQRPLLVPFEQYHIAFFNPRNSAYKAKMLNILELAGLKAITSLPDALAQVIIVDKNGSGSNFPTLAKLDKKICPYILSDDAEIDSAFYELKQSMSSVAQSITQKNYSSIEDYNNNTDEIPQAYKFIFIADYPSGFTRQSSEALLAIMSSGPKSGIYVFMGLSANSRDGLKQQLVSNIPLSELVRFTTLFEFEEPTHHYNKKKYIEDNVNIFYSPMKNADKLKSIYNTIYKIDFEKPNLTLMNNIVADLNKRIEKINIKPVIDILKTIPASDEEYWTKDASRGICVPFAKAGIENIYLSLGVNKHGEDEPTHHGLIGGTTGSGKTVALHDIILHTCINYSPDEVKFWLLDYKEGTEFATYRDFPYVEILSMESEIEFGHQVLEKAIAEMEERGKLFKNLNAQDLDSYNAKVKEINTETNSNALQKLPRVIIIIDEFQHLFPEKHTISQKTNELMNDILRRGRSFGFNLLLATQTVIGINMDQSLMSNLQLRIALKMNAQDASRFFADNNQAPKSLRDPGQGIYNRAGGAVGENIFFQAYLAKTKSIEKIKSKITGMMLDRYGEQEYAQRIGKRFVYSGDTPAVVSNNKKYSKTSDTLSAYIGEYAGLELEHLKLTFKREFADNLLIVGPNVLHSASIFAYILDQLAGSTKNPKIYYGTFLSLLQESCSTRLKRYPNADITELSNANIIEHISEISQEFIKRKDAVQKNGMAAIKAEREIFIMLYFVEGSNIMRNSTSTLYSDRSSDARSAKSHLLKVIEEGADYGIHVCISAQSYKDMIDLDLNQEVQRFKKRIVIKGNSGDSKIFGDEGIYEDSKSKNVAMYLSGDVNSSLVKFKPYIDPVIEKVVVNNV